jgi:hypothetical protein
MARQFFVIVSLFGLIFCTAQRRVIAQTDDRAGEALLMKLRDRLAVKHADRDGERAMTDLVDELAKLNYAPAKRTVYNTVFFWFGFDDTMTAHPELFAIKEKLERETNQRAQRSAVGLKDARATSIVFLNNRKELATNPKAQPQYTVLVQVETAMRIDDPGKGRRWREYVAAKLGISADHVGLNSRFDFNTTSGDNLDQRLDAHPADSLMRKVCHFLANIRDDNDDQFLRWAVENRQLKRRLASEIAPKLFPPVNVPDPAVLNRDAEDLAVKIFAHFGLEGLKGFNHGRPGSFKALLDTGVLSTEDAAKIARNKFEEFSFGKDVAFSRRYRMELRYTIDDDTLGTLVELNHLGKVVSEDKETDTSSDVATDVKIMWSAGRDGASTQQAIEAASRVFNTVKLEGMHRDEVAKLIGNPALRPSGIYNHPFWPAEKNERIFCFDNGNYGWQFNVGFDEKGICNSVTRKWIH